MIYTLKIKCVWGIDLQEPFERTVEIESDTTLDEMHGVMQSLLDFDNDHCYDFFTGKTPRDSRNSLGQDGEFSTASKKLKKITLADVFPLPSGHYLFYWFDFGDDWKFQISLKKETGNKQVPSTPELLRKKDRNRYSIQRLKNRAPNNARGVSPIIKNINLMVRIDIYKESTYTTRI